MNPINDPLHASQQEIERLTAKIKDLEDTNTIIANALEEEQYKLHLLKLEHADELKTKNNTIDREFHQCQNAEYEAYESQMKLEKIQKQISGKDPICSSVQTDLLQHFPRCSLKDTCPVCNCYNVDCKIGSHPINAENLIEKLKKANRKRKYHSMLPRTQSSMSADIGDSDDDYGDDSLYWDEEDDSHCDVGDVGHSDNT